jgi:TRAP-type mannitol/chloroaromatic compound transport system permease small subunit
VFPGICQQRLGWLCAVHRRGGGIESLTAAQGSNILTQAIGTLIDRIGRSVSWLTLIMALLTLAIVILRYGFNLGSIPVQEAVMYTHALVFMLGIPYALKHGAHVRVDVFAERLGSRGRRWVEILGHSLFLLPVCLTIIIMSTPYVLASWRVLEGSSEVGGLPAIFLLKTLIPLTALLLMLQGFAELITLIRDLSRPEPPSSDAPGPL